MKQFKDMTFGQKKENAAWFHRRRTINIPARIFAKDNALKFNKKTGYGVLAGGAVIMALSADTLGALLFGGAVLASGVAIIKINEHQEKKIKQPDTVKPADSKAPQPRYLPAEIFPSELTFHWMSQNQK